MNDAEERARFADELREETRTLLIESGLLGLLQEKFGEATVTGSAGYDLMAWRGIDLHLPCEADRAIEWLGLAAEIATTLDERGLKLHRAQFANDYLDPQHLGAGLRWTLEFADFADNHWSCDIWGFEPFDYAVRQARDANLRADLASADRDLILRLKHEARERFGYYGVMVSAMDIYQFALDGAGETLDELERWRGLVAE
ncbi:hypothetical protein [Devosia sp.]|uniref:hypothetical protein n=1 Tax=Devosia sp. TaxID=1871048 RepID=UPI003BAAF49C